MTMSPRIREYMAEQHIPYQLVHHQYSETARGCAEAAHIPPGRMAKAVLLKDGDGFFLAVVPSDKSVDINVLSMRTNRIIMTASREEVKEQFDDCSNGAVPGIGQAYDLRVIWDESILNQPDCYLEAGDHEDLIYLSRKDFTNLMQDGDHGHFCH